MAKKPFGVLSLLSCDTIAECCNVSNETYKELWAVMSDLPPLDELIDIENSCPNDALGLNTPAAHWFKFSDSAKRELLELAERDQEEFSDEAADAITSVVADSLD